MTGPVGRMNAGRDEELAHPPVVSSQGPWLSRCRSGGLRSAPVRTGSEGAADHAVVLRRLMARSTSICRLRWRRNRYKGCMISRLSPPCRSARSPSRATTVTIWSCAPGMPGSGMRLRRGSLHDSAMPRANGRRSCLRRLADGAGCRTAGKPSSGTGHDTRCEERRQWPRRCSEHSPELCGSYPRRHEDGRVAAPVPDQSVAGNPCLYLCIDARQGDHGHCRDPNRGAAPDRRYLGHVRPAGWCEPGGTRGLFPRTVSRICTRTLISQAVAAADPPARPEGTLRLQPATILLLCGAWASRDTVVKLGRQPQPVAMPWRRYCREVSGAQTTSSLVMCSRRHSGRRSFRTCPDTMQGGTTARRTPGSGRTGVSLARENRQA